MASAQGGPFFLFQLNLGFYLNFIKVYPLIKLSTHKCFYFLLHFPSIICYSNIRFPLKYIPTLVFRIFIYAENDFNHIKEEFLDHQRRNNSSVSPSQAIGCTCPFTGFSQPSCPQLSTCPYLQERATKSFISCKVLFLFHSCYYYYLLFFLFGFNTHFPLHFKNNSMKTFIKDSFLFFYFE